MLKPKPEAKVLTAAELAQRKDLENQLKLEFEVFLFCFVGISINS